MHTNLIIRILPTQVVKLWETIKYGVVLADEVNEEERYIYLNELLHALLNEKAQCFVRLSDDRRLLAVLITRFQVNKITGSKDLYLQGLYSWKAVSDEVLQHNMDFVKEFAKHEGCKRITFRTYNSRVMEIAELLGFKENIREFVLNL